MSTLRQRSNVVRQCVTTSTNTRTNFCCAPWRACALVTPATASSRRNCSLAKSEDFFCERRNSKPALLPTTSQLHRSNTMSVRHILCTRERNTHVQHGTRFSLHLWIESDELNSIGYLLAVGCRTRLPSASENLFRKAPRKDVVTSGLGAARRASKNDSTASWLGRSPYTSTVRKAMRANAAAILSIPFFE